MSDKLRLLILGSDQKWSIDKLYFSHLKKMGIMVELFTSQNIFFDFYHNSLLNKVIFRSGVSSIYNRISFEVKSIIEKYNPTVIWVFKGMELLPDLLKWIRNKGIKLINYNPDNPFIFTGKGSGNENIKKSIGLYDLHLTYSTEIQQQLISEYQIETILLPFAFEPTNTSPTVHNEIKKLCFIGNPDIQRAKFISALIKEGITIDIYGNNWHKFIRSNSAQLHTPIYGNSLIKTIKQYRIQLNLLRIHNENSHNMRTFEVPGYGGIMIAPQTTEHTQFFKDKREAFWFNSVKECAEITKYLLSITDDTANKVRAAAETACIENGHTYKKRSEFAAHLIQNL